MSITIDLSPEVEARLRADADREGRPAEALAADRLAAWYEEAEAGAVEALREAFAQGEAGQDIAFEEYVARVHEEQRRRDGSGTPGADETRAAA